MFKKVVLAIICAILVCQLFGLLGDAVAQSVERLDKTESFWVQLSNWLIEHKVAFSIVIVTTVTIFSTVMATLRRDNLLKSLAGHLITIELKDSRRHRGRLRVESEGLEAVAEKADEGLEKASYLLRKDEYGQIHALVRYHDFLTDKEKEQREAEVDRVYHPSIGMRLKRRLRNIVNEMKRVASEAFSLVFGRFKSQLNVKMEGEKEAREYGDEVEERGKELIEYATAATYDALIDRLIGTRVVAWINKDLEYVGVLKDYTNQFIELLDVNYGNGWRITMERGHNTRHERGLILRKDGNDIVVQSKSPFKVTLKNIYWEEDKPGAKREKINKTIEPFGELRFNLMPPALEVGVAPFNNLRLPQNYHYQDYKKVHFDFSSVRVADIVMLKNYGIVRHRMEKYDPKLLDFGALADALLASKGGELALQDNMPLAVHNGYLTNLPRERMDFTELDGQISKRWEVNSSFANLDKKLRPVSNYYLLWFIPFRKARKVLALFAFMTILYSDENRGKDPILAYHTAFALCNANRRGKRHSHKQEVLIKKKKLVAPKAMLAKFPWIKLRLPRFRRAVPAPTEE